MNITKKELARKIKERRVRKQLHMLHRKNKIILIVLVVVLFIFSLTTEPKNVPLFLLGVANGALVGFSLIWFALIYEEIEEQVKEIMESDNVER